MSKPLFLSPSLAYVFLGILLAFVDDVLVFSRGDIAKGEEGKEKGSIKGASAVHRQECPLTTQHMDTHLTHDAIQVIYRRTGQSVG